MNVIKNLSLLFGLLSVTSAHAVIVISDLDETMKIAIQNCDD